jgi:hypothetical protein
MDWGGSKNPQVLHPTVQKYHRPQQTKTKLGGANLLGKSQSGMEGQAILVSGTMIRMSPLLCVEKGRHAHDSHLQERGPMQRTATELERSEHGYLDNLKTQFLKQRVRE